MKKSRQIKTTKKEIVDWCKNNIPEVTKDGTYGVDIADMSEDRCMRCGEVGTVERCHVIPHSLGGVDEPHNYRLLCPTCHRNQPNVDDYEATDLWIRETHVGHYGLLHKIVNTWNPIWNSVTVHWGDSVNRETMRWATKKFLEKCKEKKIDVSGIDDTRLRRLLLGV